MGSTMELFGDFIQEQWLKWIFEVPTEFPQHTFQLLTKQPQNLAKWKFPENCWVGVTATDEMMARRAIQQLRYVQASVLFCSLEPLLGEIRNVQWNVLDWLIIGQQTPVKAATTPKIEHVQEIVEAADKAGVKVFLKDNLKPLVLPAFLEAPNRFDNLLSVYSTGRGNLRQEFPNG